ncbi:hypothetical protein SCATT_p15730 (plasmid) [Streptantibioticus cattleyicolor NRRL 8057 = DSM 46488]|uniref:Uncharacterized protein n=1 Tax=Streptantibioticus cattleyicolor (strain ATCC 35852 / DSM 46488 / JCM 4925 / NBRC 14057 / NRRL 8057) TaxID=1003195 RepID=G8XH48_STREN|nr:hypothetical protein SCATT_p15730 [Streptantibioticus cattleyicolor NRRL 8057 = DSM 46488]
MNEDTADAVASIESAELPREVTAQTAHPNAGRAPRVTG